MNITCCNNQNLMQSSKGRSIIYECLSCGYKITTWHSSAIRDFLPLILAACLLGILVFTSGILSGCTASGRVDQCATDGTVTCCARDSAEGSASVSLADAVRLGALSQGASPTDVAALFQEPESASDAGPCPQLTAPGRAVCLRDGICSVQILESE